MNSTTELDQTRSEAGEESAAADASVQAKRSEQVITWFELPALDYERAIHFYERTLSLRLKRENDPEMGEFAMFAAPEPATAGCVIHAQGRRPGADGTVVYLWCRAALDPVLARATAAGARIVAPN